MAWTRNVLRVNLTAGTCTAEPLNMAWARDYLGQRGLATKYFVSEVDAQIDPFAPENKLLFVTGPLTGTMAATGGRYSVVTKGPLTGAIACSNSGGYFGAELKFAGWDMVIVEGAAPRPVYLLITDGHAELRGRRPPVGQDGLGNRGAHQEGPPGPADPRGRDRPRWRKPRALCRHRQRPAPGGREVGRWRGDGIQEPQGGGRARHPHGRVPAREPGRVLRGDRGREAGAGGKWRDRPGTAHLRHAGADERHQRAGRAADAQPSRCAIRRGVGHFRRGHAPEAAHRRQGEPRDERRVLRLHHRLWPHLAHGSRPLQHQGQAAVPGRLGRPGVRGRLGAGRRERRLRSGGPHLRQLPLQRGRLRSHLVRRHRRRGDGALRAWAS